METSTLPATNAIEGLQKSMPTLGAQDILSREAYLPCHISVAKGFGFSRKNFPTLLTLPFAILEFCHRDIVMKKLETKNNYRSAQSSKFL
jgi:hypothetical protein